MRVSLAQVAAVADADVCRKLARAAVERAADDGADLVVLPEYASFFDPHGVPPDAAERVDGPFVTELREAARRQEIAVVAGVTLEGDDEDASRGGGRASNGLVLVDAHGDVSAVYRKVHLFDAFGVRESDRFLPGPLDGPPVMRVGDATVGVMTCYDLRFPESARRAVDAGADVVVCPAAWAAGPGKTQQWAILARARAIENTSFVVAVGMAGQGMSGNSLAVDPEGVIEACLGLDPGQVTLDLDHAHVVATRERNPSLAQRRFAVVPREQAGR